MSVWVSEPYLLTFFVAEFMTIWVCSVFKVFCFREKIKWFYCLDNVFTTSTCSDPWIIWKFCYGHILVSVEVLLFHLTYTGFVMSILLHAKNDQQSGKPRKVGISKLHRESDRILLHVKLGCQLSKIGNFVYIITIFLVLIGTWQLQRRMLECKTKILESLWQFFVDVVFI